jgi:PadR family transcriptional regulator, regulatory protein PadR
LSSWQDGVVDRASRKTADAASAAGLEAARAAVEQPTPGSGRGAGSGDPLIGDLRRAGLLPLLVLHFVCEAPSYGNQLMERIAGMTEGVLSVNPNTMYPLLRRLEERGLIEGNWEHPERRTRRFYSLTAAGRSEYERLVEEVRPFLESVAHSIDEIVREVYGP